MTSGPSPGDGPGASRGLRRRIATLAGGLVAGLGAVQLAAWTLLRPDLTGRQLAWMSAITLAAAGLGAVAAAWLAGPALRPLARLQRAASALAGRPPPPPGHAPADGELDGLARQLDELATAVQLLRRELLAAAGRLGDEARALADGAARGGASAAGRAGALQRATAIAATIAEGSREASAEAEAMLEATRRSRTLSAEGLGAAEQAVRTAGAIGEQVRRIAASMADLSERTLHVGEVVASVKDLSEQSNLLALNASIEAAKAGEHGRGFAAVAMEMRNLAGQSSQAAAQVRAILGEIQKHAREAAHATEDGSSRAALATGRSRSAGESIGGLALVLDGYAASVTGIAGRARQQAASAADLEAALADLSQATRSGAADAAALEARIADLAALAGRLQALAERFPG